MRADVVQQNRDAVRLAFERWAAGGDRFFDILADDAVWTIVGTGPSAGTFHGRETYVREAVEPLFGRLAKPTTPCVRQIWADGDHVIVRWGQDTPLKAGGSYHNEYAWFFKMKDGRAIEVVAFLDLAAYDRVLAKESTCR